MRSSPRSEHGVAALAVWPPAPTPDDVAALRAARAASSGDDRFAELEAGALFTAPPRRATAAGREPFRLDAASPSPAESAGESRGSTS